MQVWGVYQTQFWWCAGDFILDQQVLSYPTFFVSLGPTRGLRRERERGGKERGRNISVRNIKWLPPICALTCDWTWNPGMRPDWGSHPQPLVPTHWLASETAERLGQLHHPLPPGAAARAGPVEEPGRQHIPRPGIEPVTFWFSGQHSIPWATPTRVYF